MASPLISVIIPTHNEADVIERNLKAIKNQNYRNVEVIVVDDGSTDNSVRVARALTPHVFARQHAERSVQRNFGVKNASGKFLLFLDADMELTKDVLSECVSVAEKNNRIGAIAIPEKPVANNFLEQVKAFEREFYSLEGDPQTDAARFFLKKAFLEVRGYDETLTGPEDWDLPERISKSGYEISRIKSVIIHYERIPSLFRLIRKKYYYALSGHRYLSKHKLSVVGPKSIYFLRPVFYKNWRKLADHPLLTLGMIMILTLEQIAAGLGYLVGRFR